MKIRILQSASQDLREGYHFYEKQNSGLGEYFKESLFSDIDSLRVYAGIHAVFFNKYHRMLSKRFPFAIYYRVSDNIAVVYAVLDCRRDPAWIRTKLTKA
ncbi:MAG: hypothetical protein COS94_02535 [Candidatus Hydrogenedentes bacterium CG07_land_8_20_14_0_80_42_17]|nr:MAG: hypothetical protein AUJ18_02825 [Candidatus Hydrogenedentes bacterium CG1_02_42_14]PIU48370.1 MAG: hypothetical protein COS94_02535 [Candidatus Hydrogenedentes bacterium CG07_land_8_20_14_0_80_42_17]